MPASALVLLGCTGQACFSTRFLVQWLASERKRRSVAPSAFWWLSLGGAALVGAYASLRGDLLLLPGFAVSGLIYARNLWLVRGARMPSRSLWLLGAAALVLLLLGAGPGLRQPPDESAAWLVLGASGQALWVSRFVVQWLASERAGRSFFPPAFWWLSLAGNALLLAYAVHLADLVYVAGFLPGPFLQARNLILLRGGAGVASRA
jgi:lipid-A-disaccharide synthase-like uncharacterized protein